MSFAQKTWNVCSPQISLMRLRVSAPGQGATFRRAPVSSVGRACCGLHVLARAPQVSVSALLTGRGLRGSPCPAVRPRPTSGVASGVCRHLSPIPPMHIQLVSHLGPFCDAAVRVRVAVLVWAQVFSPLEYTPGMGSQSWAVVFPAVFCTQLHPDRDESSAPVCGAGQCAEKSYFQFPPRTLET